MKVQRFSVLGLVMAASCVFSTDGGAVTDPPLPVSSANTPMSYQLLFIGNSHSSANGLPALVTTLIETGLPGQPADWGLAPGLGYLSDRLNDGVTLEMLDSRKWTHVILQAQKYSTSGLYSYPTDAAEEWIRRSRTRGAAPVLFPEWPRKGNTEEGPRVHQLHLDIAAREAACVAPVGLAWEASIARYPGLALHASDGNHSNLNGALLTAYVFYQVITGLPATDLPYVSKIGVSDAIQGQLSEVASTVVSANLATCRQAKVPPETGVPALGVWGLGLLALSLAMLGGARIR